MESLLLKLSGLLKTLGDWLYTLVADQTTIEVIGSSSPTQPPNFLLIRIDQKGTGALMFGITTRSHRPVELLELSIDYSTPLQLFDPERRGFFSICSSGDETLPFRLCWKGNILLRQTIIHAFSLNGHFPIGTGQLPIRISVHSRVQKASIGGFIEYGRTQVTSNIHRLAHTYEPIGIAVPPKHAVTSIQPHIIQSALYVTTDAKDIVPLLVHQQQADGTVSSKLVDISSGGR